MAAVLPYILFFLRTVLCTLGPVVLCGLSVWLIRKCFCALVGPGMGRGIILGTSIVGTPIHELGHAAMCLLFGHKITEMALWQPHSNNGRLGFVTHRYNPRNPYHQIGNLFIGLGPIFSGLGIVTLALWCGFPRTLSTYFASARVHIGQGKFFSILSNGFSMLPKMWGEAVAGGRPLVLCLFAVIIIFAVSQHISLSPEDIKGSARALPLYGLLVLIVTVVVGLIGSPAVRAADAALGLFTGYTTALFMVVLIASLLQLAPAFLILIIRKIAGR